MGDTLQSKTCIEIKTPNCTRCKAFEPTYQELQKKYPDFNYSTLTFGIDKEAQSLATKYSIRSAPTFIVTCGDNVDVVKQEELDSTLAKYCD